MVELSKILKERIRGFPVYDNMPEEAPMCWGLYQDFVIDEAQLEETKEFRYSVTLRGTPAALGSMVDEAINIAKEKIELSDYEFLLHAVNISNSMRVRGGDQSEIRLVYIFRAEKIIYAPELTTISTIIDNQGEQSPKINKKNKIRR